MYLKTAEASLNGESPIKYAPNAESSIAYEKFAKEMVKLREKKRNCWLLQTSIH